MIDLFLDVLIDSLKIFGTIVFFYFILSFFENKLSKKIFKNHKMSPLLGSLLGIVPQCGISVVASSLYVKKHITIGTLIAVFISTSDEAIPLLLSDVTAAKMIIPFIISKVLIGFIVGFILDLIINKKANIHSHLEVCEHDEEIIKGCCHHSINELSHDENSWLESHVIHPIIHALKIFIYVFIVMYTFGLLIHFVGENTIASFFSSYSFITPLVAVLLGLIPNCASSVLLTTLYINNTINFGCALAGLIVNAGLGLFVLFKENKNHRENFVITMVLVLTGLLTGYITLLF